LKKAQLFYTLESFYMWKKGYIMVPNTGMSDKINIGQSNKHQSNSDLSKKDLFSVYIGTSLARTRMAPTVNLVPSILP
jgi:hypothetical protein